MKKLVSFALCVMMLCAAALPAGAVQSDDRNISVTVSEDGRLEIVTVLELSNSLLRTSRTAHKTSYVNYDGERIAEVTLTATFGYDGDEAWVEESESDYETYDGWRYGSERIRESGDTVSLSAKLSHATEGTSSVNISMTCSPNGTIR